MVPAMIGKDYFKRQSATLRKMVRVANDPTVANRLRDMASEFEEPADRVDLYSPPPAPAGYGAAGEKDHG